MKLIRLYTQDESGTFENLFREDIILNPNSKIGLLNLSLTPKYTIDISSSNNTFKMQTGGTTGLQDVTLNTGTYSINSLLKELNRALNSAMIVLNNTNPGFQWKSVLNNDKLFINFNRKTRKSINIPDSFRQNLNNTTGLKTKFEATGAAITPFKAFGISNEIFTKGCGYVRAKVTVQGTDSWILGFVSDLPLNTLPTSLGIDNYKYCIVGSGAGATKYKVYIDGVEVSNSATSISCTNQDTVSIEIYGGTIYFRAYRNGAAITSTTLYETNFDYNIELQSAMSMSINTTRFEEVFHFTDPYISNSLDGVSVFNYLNELNNYYDYTAEEIGDLVGVDGPTAPGSSVPSNVKLVFSDGQTELRNILGFKNNTMEMTRLSGIFKGTIKLSIASLPSSLVVELPNLTLFSYDGKTKSRRNIVAVIPTPEKDEFNLYYTAPQLIMLDINNSNNINIRNIRVKLSTLNEEEILLEKGYGTTLTLVID